MPFSDIIIYIDLWGMMALKSRCLWEQDGVVRCKMYHTHTHTHTYKLILFSDLRPRLSAIKDGDTAGVAKC